MNSFIFFALLFSSLLPSSLHCCRHIKPIINNDNFLDNIDWPSINIWDFGTEDLQQFEIVTSAAQYGAKDPPLSSNDKHKNSLGLMSSGSKKRNRELVSDDLPEAKGKGKNNQRCHQGTFFTGESSTSQQPESKRKEERLKELIEGKSVAKIVKVFRDRINRRIKNDKMADMEYVIWVVHKMISIKASHLLPQVLGSLKQTVQQWPVRKDLQNLKEKIQEILKHTGLATIERRQRLLEVGEELERLDQQREKDSKKAGNLDAIFANNVDFIVVTLRKEHSSAYLWFEMEETTTTSQDQGHGSLLTREKLQSNFNYLESILYDEGNDKVGVSDFHGLEQALKNTGQGKTPDYLEPIVTRIEKAGGKTEVLDRDILVSVCAAIHEMEELTIKDFNLDTLKKWAATLNKAKKLGFQVGFANNLLQKNLLAYFACSETVG